MPHVPNKETQKALKEVREKKNIEEISLDTLINEKEMEKTIKEVERDLREGKFVVETAEEHFKK